MMIARHCIWITNDHEVFFNVKDYGNAAVYSDHLYNLENQL
jgi:hypothetical protein